MPLNKNIKGNELVKVNGRYQSKYFHDAGKVFEELNKVSPSFCLAKWHQLTLYLQNGFNHSCHHPSPHKVSLSELETNYKALHNTQYKKQQMQKMLDGERPSECDYCWKAEDAGHISDRVYKSASAWAKINFESVIELSLIHI